MLRNPSRAPLLFALAAVLCGYVNAPGQSRVTETARILDRAIVAAGGEKSLAAATVLKWSGKAVIHAGERQIRVEGRWIVEPPDHASVVTWEIGKGESSARRMLVDGSQGWMERGGQRTPMPADIFAHERDQFYLYSVIRLLPLREPGVQLSLIKPRGLLVNRAGRPDVEAFFDDSGRLERLRTRVANPATKSQVLQEVTLGGTISAAGVNWPRTIRITWDGAAYFDLDLFEFAVGSREDFPSAAPRMIAAAAELGDVLRLLAVIAAVLPVRTVGRD